MDSGVLICTDVMARGVDIPAVDYVLQYDPPSNAEAFVHRCGRTARMGKKGAALLFLLATEQSYIEFIAINQKVTLHPYESTLELVDVLPRVRKLAAKDRDVMEKSTRAFVSFIQAYRKHECSLIFQFKELNMGKLATGFGLLFLPKMPEIKNSNTLDFKPCEIHLNSIKYLDKTREKQRQEKLVKQIDDKSAGNSKARYIKTKTKAWSKKQDVLNRKQERKEKKLRKRSLKDDSSEDEDFAKEARLLKKLKKGKISNDEFDERTGVQVEEMDK